MCNHYTLELSGSPSRRTCLIIQVGLRFVNMKKLILFLFCVPLFGQVQVQYVATTGIVSLSGAGTAATLQQPATNGLPVQFPKATSGGSAPAGASIYCSVACTATIIRNSVAATTTLGTVNQLNQNDPPPVITFYTASNYSGGTTLATIPIGAGVWQGIDLNALSIARGGNTSNLTISIASITGNVIITFYPVEQH